LLHHRGPGKELGNGGDAKHGLFGIDLPPVLNIRIAIALAENDLIPADDRDHGPGYVLRVQLHWNRAVKKRLQIGPILDIPARLGILPPEREGTSTEDEDRRHVSPYRNRIAHIGSCRFGSRLSQGFVTLPKYFGERQRFFVLPGLLSGGHPSLKGLASKKH